MRLQLSTKRSQIDRSNTIVVAAAAIAAALTIFFLLASKTLLDQRSFQSRVITKKSEALKQLQTNVEETKTLVVSYQEFVSRQQNVIGGSSIGSGERDGDNARIVLDALPSKYDFPAVVSSLEKVINSHALKIDGISGVDEEVAQEDQVSVVNPEPVAIPFSFDVSGNYASVQDLVGALQRSIRPVQVTSVLISSESDQISLQLGANTFYLPEKAAGVQTEVVK